jgi:threonine/homoserine/homoserine lactone efflux protein
LNFLFIFIAASCISFLGSVQAGPLNVSVLNTAISQNRRNALYVALGGVVPEFFYALLALVTVHNFSKYSSVLFWLKLVFILLLFVLALLYFFKKTSQIVVTENKITAEIKPFKSFIKGIIIAGFNPQLLPFWIAVLIAFSGIQLLQVSTIVDQFCFCFGATIGALGLQITLILLTKRFSAFLNFVVQHRLFNKCLAILFLLLAIQQFVSLDL